MANSLYSFGRAGFLAGQIVWAGASTIRAALVRQCAFNDAHEFVSDVTATGAVVVATQVVAGMATTSGYGSSNAVTWPAVTSGSVVNAILIYQSSAVTGGADVAPTAQRLIAYYDTGVGMPVTTLGADVTVSFPQGYLFRI